MADIYLEEKVSDTTPGKAKKRSVLLTVMQVLCGLGGAFFLLVMFFSQFLSVEEGKFVLKDYLIQLAIWLVFAVIFFVAAWLLGRLKQKQFCEYDYTFVTDSLRIARVINNSRRKFMLEVFCKDIEDMGDVDDESFSRYETMQGVKKIVATPNALNEEAKLTYLFFTKNGSKTLLIIEPSDVMRICIMRNARQVLKRR
ncbi:MAG: hypothetical protein IJF71_06930 [Clostridia bacterium]|nr:hypothetical protein [Clostridia bacterium]